jgi:integrase
MPKQTRYPGIIAMSDGRKRIRLRAVDPRTGRMKEVDRVVTVPMEEAREWHAALVDRLAKPTANNALRVLKMVLGDGCAEFNLPRSPAERVRSFPVRQSPDDDPNLLSPEELGKVLDAFRSTEPADYPLALTLALTGLRFGEASALRWSDIREDEGMIRVVRGQWKGHVSTTKTGVVRSVPLVPELAATLGDHRA